MFVEVIVILRRDDASDGDEDIVTSQRFQIIHDSRKQCLVTGGQRGEADHVHIVVDSVLRRFFRCLEERADVDVPAHIREGCRQDFLAAIVTVLSHLREENTRTTTFEFLKFIRQFLRRVELRRIFKFAGVHAGNRVDDRIETAGDFFDGVGNFAQGSTVVRRLDRHFQKVSVVAGFRCLRDGFQIATDRFRIADASEFLQTLDLRVAHGGVVDGEDVQRIFLRQTVLVQADNRLAAGIDVRLPTRGAFFDTHLRKAGRDGLGHAAERFDFLNVRPGALDDFIREVFHIVGAAPRIDDFAGLRLILDVELRVTRQTSGEIRRKRDGFVEGVRVEGLRVAERRRHGFHTGTADIVERILLRERPAGRLRMGTQRHGLRIFRAELFQNLRPEHASRAHLGDFHEIVFALVPEEGQTFRKGVDGEPRFFAAADVFHAVGQRVADFQIARRAAFLDVVAGNGNGIEFRHIFRRVFENIADDAHGHGRRINVRIADHEFLQNIILNRPGQNGFIDALLDPGGNEEGQNREDGAVHRHGNGHLIERNPVEENVHVEHGADGNARFPDVADDARIVRIVTAVRRKVKRDGKPFLPGGKVSFIKSIRFLGRGETGVLTDRPGAEDVHRGIRSAQERRDPAHEVQMIAIIVDILRIQRRDRDMLQRGIVERIVILAGIRFQLGLPFLI